MDGLARHSGIHFDYRWRCDLSLGRCQKRLQGAATDDALTQLMDLVSSSSVASLDMAWAIS